MCHNMSIYRRLNPRLPVQAGWAWAYYIGLISLIYISNTIFKKKKKKKKTIS